MPFYMVQSMSSGSLPAKTYYRKQTVAHPSHVETGNFTQAAMDNYASFNHINVRDVVAGTFRSGQGVPTGKNTFQI